MTPTALHSRFLTASAGLLLALAAPAAAEGTETLAAPSGLQLAQGTHLVLAGQGLLNAQPGQLNLTVPEGQQVVQVLAYWDGLALSKNLPQATDTIFLNAQPVTGSAIGGPSNFVGPYHAFAYRADVTELLQLGGGESTVTVSGLDFGYSSHGLTLVAVLDDGSGARSVSLRDGSDYAFGGFPGPFQSTELQTYTFEATDAEREAQLGFLVSGVAPNRPSIVEVAIDGQVTSHVDVLTSAAGPELDVLELDLLLPPGATTVSARILSEDAGTGPFAGGQVASLNWIASTFELELEAQAYGCSPLYWYGQRSAWDPWYRADNRTSQVTLMDRFNLTFGVSWERSGLSRNRRLWAGLVGYGTPGQTLMILLNRHAVTALLNADSGMGYPLSVDEVKALYRDAVGADAGPATRHSALATFIALNNLGCPW